MMHPDTGLSIKPIRAFFGVAFLLSLATSLQAATIPNTVKTTLRRQVDFGYNPSIVIGMVDVQGRDVYGYGSTELDEGTPPDEHSIYEIGSITKVFTTSLLAQMVEQSEVEYSDPVSQYLPEQVTVPEHQGTPISFEDLATHTARLPTNPPIGEGASLENPFLPFPESALYEVLGELQLDERPGSTYEYSNLGMGLLGHALSRRLESSYEQALRERIILPLGLEHTSVSPLPETEANWVTGYAGFIARPPFDMDSIGGAGVLRSTVNDLLTFLEHQLDLRDAPLNPVLQSTHARRHSTGQPGLEIGLGWHRLQLGSDTVIFHDGATMGQNAFAGFIPSRQRGVVVLSNARLHQYSSIQHLGLRTLVSQFPLSSIRRPANVPEDTLQTYEGQFTGSEDSQIEITAHRGHLQIQRRDQPEPPVTLYATGQRSFAWYETGVTGRATFTFDEDGQPDGFRWRISGAVDIEEIFARTAPTPTLAVGIQGTQVTLTLTNGDDTEYGVETSEDLHNWTPLTETITTTSPIRVPASQGAAFFRLIQEPTSDPSP